MANDIWYVDPDAVGGGTGVDWANAYTSLSACESAKQTDLVTATKLCHIYCKSSSGGDDHTAATIDGWDTSADYYIVVHEDGTDGGDGACDDVNGQYDDTKYVLKVDANTDWLVCTENSRFLGLQVNDPTTNGKKLIYLTGLGDATIFHIGYCVVYKSGGSGGAIGLNQGGSSDTTSIYNTIFDSEAADGNGCDIDDGICNIYNCTITGFWNGITRDGGTVVAKNCAVFDNGNNDFNGTIDVDNCASDDGTGDNPQTLDDTDNYANEFTDSPNGDFTIVDAVSVCDETGLDDPGTGLYSDDIAGTARSSTWDIGAFELAAAPPAAEGQVIIIQLSTILLPLFWLKQGKNKRRAFLKNTLLTILGVR